MKFHRKNHILADRIMHCLVIYLAIPQKSNFNMNTYGG